jgi:hypothetical protein
MNDITLTLALERIAKEVLRPPVRLMDNHHLAPGYILFSTDQPGRYLSYLVHDLPGDILNAPMIYGFALFDYMSDDDIRTVVVESQAMFLRDIHAYLGHILKQDNVVRVVGEDCKPVLWKGGNLDHFGMNPLHQPRYRVVYAPSRFWQVGGRWTDREEGRITKTVDEYRWIPRYCEDQGWVLEKWLPPEEYAGSRVQWESFVDAESGLMELGPYPTRGEYESCFTWAGYPPAQAVERVIQMIEHGHAKYRTGDIARAHSERLAKEKKARGDKLEAMIRNELPSFPGKGMSGSPYRSAPEPDRLTVADLPANLPSAGDFKQMN